MRFVMGCCGVLIAMSVVGCAGTGQPTGASTLPHAECLVCKANADLACVDVAVDSSTPSQEYNGKTYYFCSEECKQQFARKPTRYVAK